MASINDPVKSTAVVIYQKPIEAGEKAKAQKRDLYDFFMQRSFKTQIADTQLLNPIPIRARILKGDFPQPEWDFSPPQSYKGTMNQLCTAISQTVHKTLDHLDYNGLLPYLKVADQLASGKNFREVRIDSKNEKHGSTCVGMSLALLKNLKEKYGVAGSLAVQRKCGSQVFEHAVVIVECADGYVLLDPRSDPNHRIFSIPFNTNVQYRGFSIKATKAGTVTPLVINYEKTDKLPEATFEYCLRVANGDDIVMKHYVMEAYSSFIPISLYNSDGSARKYILVVPKESKIVFKDNDATNSKRTQTLTFKCILNGELAEKLKQFITPNYCCQRPHHFHIPIETLYQHIYKFVFNENLFGQIFRQTNLDENFE